MRNFIKLKLREKNNALLFSMPFLVSYYIFTRLIFGYEYPIIYGYLIGLLILGIDFAKISLIFFIVSIIFYLIGSGVEANHYFSFVYTFLVLSFLKEIYFIVKERFKPSHG